MGRFGRKYDKYSILSFCSVSAAAVGLLLLLLCTGVFSSQLPPVQARPSDFWCNYHVRRDMERRTEELNQDMVKDTVRKHTTVCVSVKVCVTQT